MQCRVEQLLFVLMQLCLWQVCVCVCFADDFPVMIFTAEQRAHESWLASVAKHSVWQETEQLVISAKTLMGNLTQTENAGVYA